MNVVLSSDSSNEVLSSDSSNEVNSGSVVTQSELDSLASSVSNLKIGDFRGTVQQFNQNCILHKTLKSLDVDQVKDILGNAKSKASFQRL